MQDEDLALSLGCRPNEQGNWVREIEHAEADLN